MSGNNAQIDPSTSGMDEVKKMAGYNVDGAISGVAEANKFSYACDIGLNKAGMEDIDTDEVKRVIAECSNNSEYFKT